ncbi:hypothetical protein OE88DRAFT_1276197 [Heliocybe sulcata]|uniref:Uncharacterized protein n=1 Tax=Heliocybe sulcata TaxID=5364 RepID=A0A5C3N8U1_9AGAM|nr:hypothetical protein OE88DRAFT_1276197 [Heliocybe sulcata]
MLFKGVYMSELGINRPTIPERWKTSSSGGMPWVRTLGRLRMRDCPRCLSRASWRCCECIECIRMSYASTFFIPLLYLTTFLRPHLGNS